MLFSSPVAMGPMEDLLDDPDAGTVMRHFHETSKRRQCSAMARFHCSGSSEFKGVCRRAGGGRFRWSARKGEGLDLCWI